LAARAPPASVPAPALAVHHRGADRLEHFQRAAFNRIDGLAKRAKGQDAVFDILTKLDDDDAKALEGARQIRTKAQAQFDATPSIDDIYRDLAIAYVGESFSQREEGFFFKDTITTGKVFVEIRLDESGNERFKSARLAAPGADRLADAFFPGGGALDLLTAPLRRQVKVEMRGDMTEYYEEPLLGRTITYELDPGARTLAGSTTTEVGTDAGAGPTNVAAYNPSQILVKRGEMRFIPEEKS